MIGRCSSPDPALITTADESFEGHFGPLQPPPHLAQSYWRPDAVLPAACCASSFSAVTRILHISTPRLPRGGHPALPEETKSDPLALQSLVNGAFRMAAAAHVHVASGISSPSCFSRLNCERGCTVVRVRVLSS